MVQFGMWMFDEKLGLIGKPENQPEIYLSIDQLWSVKETSEGPVWKWPIKLARIAWFTPAVADEFNKTFFYARNFLKGFSQDQQSLHSEIDVRTIQAQTEILSDYFPGPEDDFTIRA